MGVPFDARITGMEHKVNEIKQLIEGISDRRAGNQNVSHVQIAAGGIGVWLATTACMVMLATLLMGAMWGSREFARIDKELLERKEEGQRMQSYLSAIYVQAPSLKPQEEKSDAQ